MIDLERFKLKEKYRKVFDELSDNDKIITAFKRNANLPLLSKIVIYYGLEDNELLKSKLAFEKYGQDAHCAYFYVQNVIKGRWELAEPTIAQDASWAYCYALDVIKGRWELAEPTIAQNAAYAYGYARDVIKGRFELAEPTIAQDASYAHSYARDVIKGRWELAELTIDNK